LELKAAERLGRDAVSMSPVRLTATHPEQASIDWTGLAAAARYTYLPCFALGGMSPADLSVASAAGAHGIAAIRSLWG
jgi:8-oxo-dGTP diphosphatase